MKSETQKPSSDDVLSAFALEPNHDRLTLERYLRDFPQFAIELALLSQEIARPDAENRELSDEDKSTIDEAWKRIASSFSPASKNLLAELSVLQQRNLANCLGVPRQIIAAFREQRVIVASIPKPFLERFAEVLKAGVDDITAALTVPSGAEYARSHKSDVKPVATAPATFEQLLIEAGVSPEKREELMSEG